MKPIRFTFNFALVAVVGLLLASNAKGQLTTLHTFAATSGAFLTNSDGAKPAWGLLLSGNVLYGTTHDGGVYGAGAVFAINTNGTGFTNLYSAVSSTAVTPSSPVVLSGNTLYGLSDVGGAPRHGTVFKVNTDGTVPALVYFFTNSGGASPVGELALAGDRLYGTTFKGGSGAGSVFAVSTNGSGFTNLHRFTGGATNSGGNFPQAGVILSGSTLYGTARQSGAWGSGTIFAVNTNSTGFTNLHSFAVLALNAESVSTNNEGALPQAGLVLSGTRLYGTAPSGGGSGNGTVFALNTDGSGFTVLHSFSAFTNADNLTPGTNNDGGLPLAGLALSGNTLYGTTAFGGSSGSGTLFAINTDGGGFTSLYSFSAPSDGGSSATNSDGISPYGGLVISGNALYGTTQGGGSFGNGTVFRFLLPPPPPALSIASVSNQTVLFWPASATNYVLESTTNLASPNWVPATDAVPVNAVTVSNTLPARFFQLRYAP
jgi:uncharacterized repeat protein (TIGR03803 family)